MHEKEEIVSIRTSQLAIFGLAALFLLGAFQTWQLANTLTTINSLSAGTTVVFGSATQSQAQAIAPAGSGVQTPSSLTNLPRQVGGC